MLSELLQFCFRFHVDQLTVNWQQSVGMLWSDAASSGPILDGLQRFVTCVWQGRYRSYCTCISYFSSIVRSVSLYHVMGVGVGGGGWGVGWGKGGGGETNVSRALQNILSTKIILLMRMPIWNFVRVPKAMLWAHVQSFRLTFSVWMLFLALYIFAGLFWRTPETVVKQPPGQYRLGTAHQDSEADCPYW